MKPRASRRSAPIDWPALRARLARAIAATEAGWQPSPEQARALLDQRARALARPGAATPAQEQVELLTFRLGDERYAVETRHVWEVIRAGALTPVPEPSGGIAGLTGLRGEVLVVMDPHKLFCRRSTPPSDPSRIVVLGRERPDVGLLVDRVDEIVTLPREAVLPPRTPRGSTPDGPAGWLLGVTGDALTIVDGGTLRDVGPQVPPDDTHETIQREQG